MDVIVILGVMVDAGRIGHLAAAYANVVEEIAEAVGAGPHERLDEGRAEVPRRRARYPPDTQARRHAPDVL